MNNIAIITVSDQGSKGYRKDVSGETIQKIFESVGGKIIDYVIVPDEIDSIQSAIIRATDEKKAELVLTTGGTGFAKRDVTPEATRGVIEKIVPGISELIRMESYKKTPQAILSRGIAGIRKESLIINLPGSPRAVRESLEIILNILPHGIAILKGEASECGKE